MWQADTLCGPMIKIKGSTVMTRLIAFIDDASRVVAHGQFFAAENVDTLIQSFRTGLYKRGIPQQLYVDNGSVYSSQEMALICSRLGILLSHTPVRDGAAKGKIERFFRTVRECFLSRQLDLSCLDALNRQFIEWLEHDYNGRSHSSLGMKPIDRFGLDLKRVRFLPPDPANDELFFLEECRSVSKTNTFQLHKILFEAPVDLRGKKIEVRFDRLNFDHFRVVVYFKNERLGVATPLDLVANDRAPAFHRQTLHRITLLMLRSYFGLSKNPFDLTRLTLLAHQQDIFDTLGVHCQQGGFCLLLGQPGTGKSVIKSTLLDCDPKRYMEPVPSADLIAREWKIFSPGLTQVDDWRR